ncbi:Myomegalin [Plecturocebus cupreus]
MMAVQEELQVREELQMQEEELRVQEEELRVQEEELQVQAADMEPLTRKMQIKEDLIKDLQIQLVIMKTYQLWNA